MSDVYGAENVDDPYAQPGKAEGVSRIDAAAPPGSDVIINDDGSVEIVMDDQAPPPADPSDHFANLAEVLEEGRLTQIAKDMLDAIKVDKESREKRDKQYEEGLRRTGLGDDAPGGASFPGASKVVHPVLTEACIDFAARVMNEMLPPEGPVKSKVIGANTDQKDERADRVSRYMNLQLTELMPNVYHEFEMGFTQCPLGGAFYTKMYYGDDGPSVVAIPIDKVHRPWSDGAIYTQPRITHEQEIDRWQYHSNVNNGLWRDVLNIKISSDSPEQTASSQSNDRIIGREQTSENIDNIRIVYETSALLSLEDDDSPAEPYLVTIDADTEKVLAIYRNWREDDPLKKRLDFLIEWPFWPWRGGYPIGMTHMIGGLSGAATGSLRALLDAAHLNNSQTGIRLKGGATAGGQNIRAQPTQTTEVQGSLAQDDVRKTYMPLPFNPPSPVLFQLLGFLVDAARGVVRTTFDEYDKFGGNTPVGTANMFIEQGLKNLGAVHGRLHRSMRRFLKQLWDINARTINNVEIQDDYGELIVSREDFAGPLMVVPVSDPRIFSDMQRQSLAQLVVQRSQALPMVYDMRKTELYFLKQMNVPNPEQFLQPQAQPVQQNAVAENTTASNGLPIKAFPGQDHEAHLAVHLAYMQSPLFGSNTIIATKYLPAMLQHLAEHIALWYSNAMLEAANAALRAQTGNEMLTIESLSAPQFEAPLDRMLAELTPEVMQHADEVLGPMPQVIAQAQMLMQRLAPQQPMDPSIVAMKDVDRQTQADQANTQLKLVSEQNKAQQAERKDMLTAQKMQLDAEKLRQSAENSAADRELREREAADRSATAAHGNELRLAGVHATNQSRETVANIAAQVKLETNSDDNETALEITDSKIKADKAAGNLKTGTGQDPGNVAP
ncbi:MAG: hypothetical protein RLZZ393_581 [Pseudomonadota bacterium]|jgi:hypothetical protein